MLHGTDVGTNNCGRTTYRDDVLRHAFGLGSLVVGCAADGVATMGMFPRQAEVGDAQVAVPRHEQVPRLQIPVNNPAQLQVHTRRT